MKLQQDFPSHFWQEFTLDISSGFTEAGILRIDSSINTYIYWILAAQAQTRSRILEQTTGIESQIQFISLVEDCINTVAGSELDFVYGVNLYMAPSDMSLNITRNIAGYNNEILVVTDDL